MQVAKILPIYRDHDIHGAEMVAEMTFGETIEFYAKENFQLVLTPNFDDGVLIGFTAKPYPAGFEMQADF